MLSQSHIWDWTIGSYVSDEFESKQLLLDEINELSPPIHSEIRFSKSFISTEIFDEDMPF